MKLSDSNEGIAYHENQIKYAYDIANDLGIKVPEIKKRI
jgi:LPS O-antigen subunit length determinant protein (WzzB/FepE family)